jgi:hypothetical protein
MPPFLPDGEIGEARVRFLADLASLAPELEPAGAMLLERVSTPNWALDRTLPYWLGQSLALPSGVVSRLVLSSTFLLAFIRLADDLVDGDAGPEQIPLALVLHHLWLMETVCLVGTERRFWETFDESMTQFLRGTLGAGRHPPEWRGAAVKAGAAAACVLAQRQGDIPLLCAALDDVMAAVVLLDDAFDWEKDLAAGRHSAFVAHCSGLPQTPEHLDANRRAVLETIYLRRGARAYFTAICVRLAAARKRVRSIGCSGLAEFIDWYDDEVAECAGWLEEESRRGLVALAAVAETRPCT